ncbi:LysR family transcriptional regulator substrate-binding protein [Streptomyces sp. AD681]|uniref:LysR family transcriptional regulator substrate-binding protein n=1 Tax=Streptomyces sp. AD681 TaxID=3019069 RepID=UPI0022F16AC8|nr:LysR family transcriptional regulator substrate-binding protein [Streptomyces sp. AD681]MDA5147314.1 LysR family transcriptional regulator substrate-binding protein [Streptomyces sp. AD681]
MTAATGTRAAEPRAAQIEVLPSGGCEQEGILRDGRADSALMHKPFNSLSGFDSEELMTEGQIAVLPARHLLAARRTLTVADVSDIPIVPSPGGPATARTPPGPGPEIHGPRLAVDRACRRPLTDAPPVVTHLAWSAHSRSPPSSDNPYRHTAVTAHASEGEVVRARTGRR